jgi:hypothetical protein
VSPFDPPEQVGFAHPLANGPGAFLKPDDGHSLRASHAQAVDVSQNNHQQGTDAMNGLGCAPNNNLLGDRSENEACCLAEPVGFKCLSEECLDARPFTNTP